MRIDKKQLLYLHRILNRDPTHWTAQMLKVLGDLNIGWHKKITTLLTTHHLPSDLNEIKAMPFNTWKGLVTTAIEKQHKNRLKEDCHKTVNGQSTPKTKTATILPQLDTTSYERKPRDEILLCTKNQCKIIIIARYKMLECGINYKGTLTTQCTTCDTTDNEEHRLNSCIRYENVNFYHSEDEIPFDTIYSTNIDQLKEIISRISQVWNVRTGHGSMNT